MRREAMFDAIKVSERIDKLELVIKKYKGIKRIDVFTPAHIVDEFNTFVKPIREEICDLNSDLRSIIENMT